MDSTKSSIEVIHNNTTAHDVGEMLVSMTQYALNHPFRFGLLAMLCLAYFWGVFELLRWVANRLTSPTKPSTPPEPVDWVIDIRDPAGNIVRTVTIPAEQVGRMTRAWDDQRKPR